MKKKIMLFLTVIMSLLSTSLITYANTIYQDTSVSAGSDYSCYIIEGKRFLTPAYYSSPAEINEDSSAIMFSDAKQECLLLYSSTMITDPVKQKITLYGASGFKDVIKNTAKEIFSTSNIGPVEELTAKGMKCYLSTSNCDDPKYMVKIAYLYDNVNDIIYLVALYYNKVLDSTRYVTDFYRYIYETPGEANNVQQGNVSSGSSDYDALHDYIGMLDDYVDTIEQIDNGNYTDGLAGLADLYSQLYEYEQKYGY